MYSYLYINRFNQFDLTFITLKLEDQNEILPSYRIDCVFHSNEIDNDFLYNYSNLQIDRVLAEQAAIAEQNAISEDI